MFQQKASLKLHSASQVPLKNTLVFLVQLLWPFNFYTSQLTFLVGSVNVKQLLVCSGADNLNERVFIGAQTLKHKTKK